MADKFLHEQTRDSLIANVKAIPHEIGQTLTALFREGLKDLRNVVMNPFPEHHVAVTEEPGTPGVPTQYEVYQERHEPPETGMVVSGRKVEMER